MQSGHGEFARRRVMIMAAPNGARRGKAEHPALPLTADELADCAADLAGQGVSVLHLHVRDRDGRHTLDPDAYRAATQRIRERTGDALVIQITTESVGRYSPTEQMAVVRELRPEAVSLALRELCPDETALPVAAAFFDWLVAQQTWPQYILHSAEDARRFEALRRRGVFADEHPSCLLVLGRYGDRYGNRSSGDPADLDLLLAEIDPDGASWSVCCFGPREAEAAQSALDRGGHVRIGFENNLLLADGSPARDNAELVAQFRATIERSSRRPATADEVREEFIGGRS